MGEAPLQSWLSQSNDDLPLPSNIGEVQGMGSNNIANDKFEEHEKDSLCRKEYCTIEFEDLFNVRTGTRIIPYCRGLFIVIRPFTPPMTVKRKSSKRMHGKCHHSICLSTAAACSDDAVPVISEGKIQL